MFLTPAISFPGLGIGEINPSQTLPFTIFGKEIYWYGVIIAFGFLLAALYGFHRCREFGLKSDTVVDGILYAVPAAIIGARLYYVIFNWSLYRDNPISALYIWNGGLAIYGGIIGAVLGLLLYTKTHRQKLTPLLDLAALGLLIGQFIGRWGNFINREAYGAQITGNFFLRMGLTVNGETTYYHPTFLYESVWNLAGFVLIHILSKSRRRKYDGQVFLWYVAWYGLGRVWIEGLRTDSLYLFGTGIRVSQLLALLCVIVAGAFLAWLFFVKKPGPEQMYVNRQPARAPKPEENSQ